jgi:hypothetical protein
LDKPIELVGADGIEPGGRFVEEQDLGVERQGAGQPGALRRSGGASAA